MMGSGSGLGRQRPPDRCKRRMNSHIVTALSPSRSFCTNPSPHAHASSGWGEAPLYIRRCGYARMFQMEHKESVGAGVVTLPV